MVREDTKVRDSLSTLMWYGARKQWLMAKKHGVGGLRGVGMSKEVELHTITFDVLTPSQGRDSLRPIPTIAPAPFCDFYQYLGHAQSTE